MNMIYAALLLHSAKKEINEENLKKIAKAIEENVDEAQIKALVAALEGVNIDEAIRGANFPVATSVTATQTAEEKKEEKKEEETEKKAEEAAAALSSLFG
ncbi:MAG: 50S ribosomal protein L12 [Candidatus Aenigmatarchaeota archaeon]|nr:50S ribosomal protein L12 [Candidatus Aenigmarchaeota archaeon]